ncbi:hypothetical protein CDAR_31781 [Caerostris darwini]|uniref:Uncharacterized protein n=1 Tax=Caerostris darwini TaxID=1538125 RepID=A0AAV4NQT8_9ARAC|nr:hypothetical protein CDAR_31781 [Caerostris darwini]
MWYVIARTAKGRHGARRPHWFRRRNTHPSDTDVDASSRAGDDPAPLQGGEGALRMDQQPHAVLGRYQVPVRRPLDVQRQTESWKEKGHE